MLGVHICMLLLKPVFHEKMGPNANEIDTGFSLGVTQILAFSLRVTPILI